MVWSDNSHFLFLIWIVLKISRENGRFIWFYSHHSSAGKFENKNENGSIFLRPFTTPSNSHHFGIFEKSLTFSRRFLHTTTYLETFWVKIFPTFSNISQKNWVRTFDAKYLKMLFDRPKFAQEVYALTQNSWAKLMNHDNSPFHSYNRYNSEIRL